MANDEHRIESTTELVSDPSFCRSISSPSTGTIYIFLTLPLILSYMLPTYTDILIRGRGTMSQIPTRLAFRAAQPWRRHKDPTSYFRACRAISSTSIPSTRIPANPIPSRRLPRTSTRQFSHTNVRPATVVRQNPRVDDDGKAMTIEISERAAKVYVPSASLISRILTYL